MGKDKIGKCYRTTVVARNVGRKIASSKKMIKWGVLYENSEHIIMFKHSIVSGKKQIYLDNGLIFESKDGFFKSEFHHDFNLGKHRAHVDVEKDTDGYLYSLFVDDVHYSELAHLNREQVSQMLNVGLCSLTRARQQFPVSSGKGKKLDFVPSGSDSDSKGPTKKMMTGGVSGSDSGSDSDSDSGSKSESDSDSDSDSDRKKKSKKGKDKKGKGAAPPAPVAAAPAAEVDLFGLSAPSAAPPKQSLDSMVSRLPAGGVDASPFGAPGYGVAIPQQQQPQRSNPFAQQFQPNNPFM